MVRASGANRWQKTGHTLDQGGQAQIFVVVDSQGEYTGDYAFKQLTNLKRRSRLDNEIMTTKGLFTLGAPVLRIIDDYLASEDDAPRPWYVTPIVQGGNLRKWLKRKFPRGPSEDWVLDFFEKCCDGLQQIHSSGVAHRDIKPENVLIDDAGSPVFCDLGLCLPLDEDMGVSVDTDDLERIGSLHYTPREGYGGIRPRGEAQFAFDVFASGKILYELLNEKVLPGLESHRTAEYDLVRLKGGAFYEAVNVLLDGMLHDEPEVRLRTWKDIDQEIDALRRALPGQPETREEEIRARLSIATSRFTKKSPSDVREPTYSLEESQARCTALAEKALQVWSDDSEAAVILDEWLSAHTDIAARDRRIENSIFASFFEGPYIHSKRGLDPLRSAGWKRASDSRQEVLLGFSPNPPKEGVGLAS